ncbi:MULTISPECIES: hypothetical protein [Amycolatopsis]|uniref:hypothetical protein n=1 Tax=Amycolatopsis TaxID=1813 RepID=UPI0003A9118A|nr:MULTISPECIES: hypothetical protein [Amycolatopsis]MCG3750492.1 hypothetical protein [Amycolatopsis sp. Poz14]
MTAPDQPSRAGTEPASIAEAVRLVLVAVVAIGWWVIPDQTINVIVSAVGTILSVVSSVLVRRPVVPVAKLDQD